MHGVQETLQAFEPFITFDSPEPVSPFGSGIVPPTRHGRDGVCHVSDLPNSESRPFEELVIVAGRRKEKESDGAPNPNLPDIPHYGAGEAMCMPTLAGIGNAIFDATGVRIRRVPFRDARVLSALKTARV